MLHPEAVDEIMERLSANLKISADEIAEILEKHGVSGDVSALQSSYRKRIGQRLMASIRDETGKREVLSSNSGEYVIIECCNDPQQLHAIQRRIQSGINGFDASSKKVRGRLQFLNRFSSSARKKE